MQIEIKEVAGRGDLRKFIYLPEQIHAGHDSWVHPIFMDDRKYFDPARNKSFAYCETTRVLAWREGAFDGKPEPRQAYRSVGSWASSTLDTTRSEGRELPASATSSRGKNRRLSLPC